MASVGAVQNRKKGKMETGRADWAPVGFLFMTIECSQSVHSIVSCCVKAVSYTHLDVYKRQVSVQYRFLFYHSGSGDACAGAGTCTAVK